jgi:hypothetical protein
MRAITLMHPWAWAICCLGKNIENRSWAPSLQIGEKFAIHGGRWPLGADECAHGTADLEYVAEIVETVRVLKEEGLCKIDGPVSLRTLSAYVGIVAVATFGGIIEHEGPIADSPWFSGPVGWILKDVLVLPQAVPCRGERGMWTVPDDVLGRMREQFRSKGDR